MLAGRLSKGRLYCRSPARRTKDISRAMPIFSHRARGRAGGRRHRHGCGTRRCRKGNLKGGGDGGRGRHHVPNEDAGVARGQRRTGEIHAGNRNADRGSRIAGIRREGRDGRGADTTRVADDRQQIADGIIRIRRDMALPVDHLREPAEVVVDVLGLISNGLRRHTGHSRQKFG